MIASDDTAIRVLNHLLVIGRAAESGFKAAALDAHNPKVARLCSEYAAQREKFVAELEARLTTMRARPEKKRSLVVAVHRKWMDAKAATAENAAYAILEEMERAEDLAVKAYGEALAMQDLDGLTRTLIQRQYELVQAAHDRIRQLRERAANELLPISRSREAAVKVTLTIR